MTLIAIKQSCSVDMGHMYNKHDIMLCFLDIFIEEQTLLDVQLCNQWTAGVAGAT